MSGHHAGLFAVYLSLRANPASGGLVRGGLGREADSAPNRTRGAESRHAVVRNK
jgi:hypothetical protein